METGEAIILLTTASHTISNRTTLLKVALMVGVAVIALGLVIMKRYKSKAIKQSKKAKYEPPAKDSPKLKKKVATGIGSVQTPSGRRSARLARKSL
jgi:hypothetical protein